ncbi:hypothetical protein, partial [Corallococcus sp. 4LFB]|uniref:hypothetical protein n=1 Tax=Corallococcus sp. 4LFB TaxID=3383249 RepID=UPI003975DDB9
AGHLQVFDTATRTLQWERAWAEETGRKDWTVLSALMTDAATVVLNIQEPPPPPPAFPTKRNVVSCDATACQNLHDLYPSCWYAQGRTDLLRCSGYSRCSIWSGCEYQYAYFDATARYLTTTVTDGLGRPDIAISEDLTQHVSMLRGESTDTLYWSGPAGDRKVEALGAVDMALFTLLPGAERLVFAQRLTRSNGESETRVATWDGVTLKDLLSLPGVPANDAAYSPVVRDAPLSVYVTVAGPSSLNIVRIRL